MISLRQFILFVVVLLSIAISVMDWCVDLTLSPTLVQTTAAECRCPCDSDEANSTISVPTVATTEKTFLPLEEIRKLVDMEAVEGLEYLDEVSLNRYHDCVPRENPHDRLSSCSGQKNCAKPHCYKNLRFLNRTKPITALVSFPGSGNTWMRYLIEQATGVLTGSVYCDRGLKVVHPGEHIVTGNVIVVKTHQAEATLVPVSQEMFGKAHFNQAIFLIRNPYDALLSEANRRWGGYGHTGLANEKNFIGNPSWEWFLQYKTTLWSYQILTWLDQSIVPVHIVQYENLVTNTRQELEKVMDFLKYSVPSEIIDCVMKASDGYFKRSKHLNFDPYSPENIATVSRIVRQADKVLSKYGIHYSKPDYH